MPGIHAIIGNLDETKLNSMLKELLHEDHFRINVLEKAKNSFVLCLNYEGYPFEVWNYGSCKVVVDGMIYNYGENEIELRLRKIAARFQSGENTQTEIRNFVESVDGDYIVILINVEENRLLIFNDYSGRIPVYYYVNSDMFILGREIKFLVNTIPQPLYLNKVSIVEHLLFEYTLGNKTLFHDLLRLEPSQGLQVFYDANNVRYDLFTTANFNFCLAKPFDSKSESLDYLSEVFIASVRDRVESTKRRENNLIADLSGGFDTRAVLGGLSKISQDVSYFTLDLVTGDESAYARQAFDECGSPGSFHIVNPDRNRPFHEIPSLVYKTDGLVDYWTTSACYDDARALKNQAPSPAYRFLGFGGEFIRHPYIQFYDSLEATIEKGFYSIQPVKTLCKLVNFQVKDFQENLHSFVGGLPEKNPNDLLRRFYYQYYKHLVGDAGEERGRIYFWSMAPLWSLEFIKTIFERVPLSWVGYAYFTEFLRRIDPRLLKAPIYKKPDLDLSSYESVSNYDIRNKKRLQKVVAVARREEILRWMNRPKSIIKSIFPFLYSYYISRRYPQQKSLVWEITNQEQERDFVLGVYKSIEFLNDFFVLDDISKIDGTVLMRLTTLGMYISELEKRFPGKVSGIK